MADVLWHMYFALWAIGVEPPGMAYTVPRVPPNPVMWEFTFVSSIPRWGRACTKRAVGGCMGSNPYSLCDWWLGSEGVHPWAEGTARP